MADQKKRFQTYLYVEREADIIQFLNGLRKTDKRMVFVSAIRMYMMNTGHYLRNATNVLGSEPLISIMDKEIPLKEIEGTDAEIEALETLSSIVNQET
ncbi:hypothetical protein ACFL6B_05290 [Thermodesulfobacteriota bacterium]